MIQLEVGQFDLPRREEIADGFHGLKQPSQALVGDEEVRQPQPHDTRRFVLACLRVSTAKSVGNELPQECDALRRPTFLLLDRSVERGFWRRPELKDHVHVAAHLAQPSEPVRNIHLTLSRGTALDKKAESIGQTPDGVVLHVEATCARAQRIEHEVWPFRTAERVGGVETDPDTRAANIIDNPTQLCGPKMIG
ncbi:MAG: hypothetical protein L0Z50_32150 [Verrucomicrobiales bacterium]|nr:hypothetical protein [Verrucomicrobiales bacterium]